MTLTLELVRDMLQINVCANLQVHRSNGLASRAQTDRRKHRQTDTHIITYSAYAGGN